MQNKNLFFRALLLILTGGMARFGIAEETTSPGQTLYPAGSQQSFKGSEA